MGAAEVAASAAAAAKNYREIPLRNKQKEVVGWAKCSPEDYEELMKYKWYRDKGGYARTNWNSKSIAMHQYLKQNGLPKGHVIDHINSDRLDNRISNLRYATVRQNNLNKKRKSTFSTNFRGVTKNEKWNSFTAYGNYNGKSVNLGSTKSEIEAAEIYDRWVLTRDDFDEGFRILNFPDKIEMYKQNPYTKQSNQTSKYIGVHRLNKKFVAKVSVEKQRLKVCYSESELNCAKAYDKYIYDHKIDRKLNFPEDYPDHTDRVSKCIKTNMKCINSDTVELILTTNQLQKQVKIDLEDYERVKLYTVNIDKDGYVRITVSNKRWLLHRYLLEVTDTTIIVDHIDSNPSNCKKK